MSASDIIRLTHKICYSYVRATKGVPYAPPAYYADRLCERGRAYLRPYFSGDPTVREQMENFASEFETVLDEKRAQRFPKSKKPRKGKNQKSENELKKEREDREVLATELGKEGYRKVEEHFYSDRQNPGGNPWNEEIDKVMFWM